MIVLAAIMISSLCFGSDQITKLTPEQYEEVKNDKLFLDILSQEMNKEQNKIMRNKAILRNIESDLDTTMKHGVVEKEFCIRQSISSLRMIDYVYAWVLKQIENTKYNLVKLDTIQKLDRIRYINKLFEDRTLRIEECKQKLSSKSKNLKNELFNDRVPPKKEAIKTNVLIPEDYPAARSPFR